MESQVLDAVEKPFLDEDAFQQLLAAAYVLQQQNDFEKLQQRLAPSLPKPRANPEKTLAVIAETQHLLRTQSYDRTAAANLIAERLQKIIHAQGVAIALAHDDKMEYCAALGSTSSLAGSSIPLPAESGDVPSATDADPAISWKAALAWDQPAGEHNSIALPLRFDGKVAGILEVRFKNADAINQHEVHICQLMAGLMIEALARSADLEWKQALAAERANMVEALERIQPQLERLAAKTPDATASNSTESASTETPAQLQEELLAPHPAQAADLCYECGYKFGPGERFCGKCGKPRPTNSALKNLQDTTSSGAIIQRGAGANGRSSSATAQLHSAAGFQPGEPTDADTAGDEALALVPAEEDLDTSARTKPLTIRGFNYETDSPWSSSRKTRLWLESLQPDTPARRWIDRYRANLYVVVAVALLMIAIWGIRSPVPAPSKNPPPPTLSLFDEILVDLGVAEAPPAPVYSGNPSAQVWVDMHTALYYCAGSDLYGKTPGGKYTTQRDAQLDQFQPAAQHTCN